MSTSFPDEARLGTSGKVLARAVDEGRAAFIGYLPAGYPSVDMCLDAFKVVARGADIVEIGIPYSDPVLDGTVIQHATTKALRRGFRVRDAFRAVEAVAGEGSTPVVMTYWNLIEQYGAERFARDLGSAGGAGVITPDLTPDQEQSWFDATDASAIDRIFLIAPSSTDERIASTMQACRGWVYATSVMGVTGARSEMSAAAPVIVERARAIDAGLPIGVGLGVSNGEQAAQLGAFADAAIVGSALVRCLESDGDDMPGDLAKLETLVADLADGVRRARK